MNDAVQKRASTRLRIRSKLKDVSLIYAIALRKLATELTGRGNLQALFGWCEKQGVGIDGFLLSHLPGGSQGEAWLDARRQRGIFVGKFGDVAATLVDGKVKGDASYAAWLTVLPSTTPAGWGAGAAPVAGVKAAVKVAALSARVDLELASRAQLEKLKPVHRKQLAAASKELCGKKGLAALMKSCDAEGQGLAHVVVASGKTPRFEGWLTAALEDGVFFDAGAAKPNGLVVSQAEVDASVTARKPEVAALQRAMSQLRAPRAPRWKG